MLITRQLYAIFSDILTVNFKIGIICRISFYICISLRLISNIGSYHLSLDRDHGCASVEDVDILL